MEASRPRLVIGMLRPNQPRATSLHFSNINDAAEADGAAAVQAGPEKQHFRGELRAARAAVEIPVRAGDAVCGTTFQNRESRPAVATLAFGPFPDAADF